jgi:hypothetical protein
MMDSQTIKSYQLSKEEHASILEEIKADYLGKADSVDNPALVITAGQPASGKGRLVGIAEQELSEKGGGIIIDPDSLRAYHPHYHRLNKIDEKGMSAATHYDAKLWSVELASAAMQQNKNIILDQTSADFEKLVETVNKFKDSGYTDIELKAMSVPNETSKQGIYYRYEKQKEMSGSGRFVEPSIHDEISGKLDQTMQKVTESQLINKVSVYDRYHKPIEQADFEKEKQRPFTEIEKKLHDSKWSVIDNMMELRNAPYTERLAIQIMQKEDQEILKIKRDEIVMNTEKDETKNLKEKVGDKVEVSAETVKENSVSREPSEQEKIDEREGRKPSRVKYDYVVPSNIQANYVHTNNVGESEKFFHRDNSKVVAFEDKGERLNTKNEDTKTIGAMLDVAKVKGWESIAVNGSAEFRREAWLEGQSQGLDVRGHKPNEKDFAELEQRRQDKAIAKTETKPEQSNQVAERPTVTVYVGQGAEKVAEAETNAYNKANDDQKTHVSDRDKNELAHLESEKKSYNRSVETLKKGDANEFQELKNQGYRVEVHDLSYANSKQAEQPTIEGKIQEDKSEIAALRNIADRYNDAEVPRAGRTYTGTILNHGEDTTVQKTATGKLIVHQTENVRQLHTDGTNERQTIKYISDKQTDVVSIGNDIERQKEAVKSEKVPEQGLDRD